jgi:hypothetical protein
LDTPLPNWLAQQATARIAFILGGEADDARALLSGSGMPPLVTICDKGTAEQLAQAAVLDGRRAPFVMISRGLRKDCEALVAAGKAQVTLVHAAIFERYVADEQIRLGKAVQLLGGYEGPSSVIAQVVMAAFWRFAAETSARLSAPVIVHLRRAPTVLPPDGAFTIFELPRVAPLAPLEVPPEALVAIDAVAGQAKFLADSELDLLVSMHKPLAIDKGETIFGFWDSALSSYLRSSGQAALVMAARSKLAAVRARVVPGPGA